MSKEFSFPNKGTCSKQTNFVLNDDHTIASIEVIGGCNGNLKGICQLLTGMKAVGKYDVLHGLVANPQPNPQCTESNEKLDALYQQAIPLAVRLIEAYAETLDTDTPLDKAYDHTFGEF